MEIWKALPEEEKLSLYNVSNLGRVKNIKSGKFLQASDDEDKGYLVSSLKRDGSDKRNMYPRHRLVAMAFLPRVPGKDVVDHINGIRNDNRVENLRWVDKQENAMNKHGNKGGGKSFPVIKKDEDGNVIQLYDTVMAATATMEGVSNNRLTYAIRNGIPLNGFYWERHIEQLDGEEWKTIELESVSITVSNKGRVKTKHGITAGSKDCSGYMYACPPGYKRCTIHRLVCIAFHGPPNGDDNTVNHIDKNRANNCPENLEWLSMKGQIIHRGSTTKTVTKMGRAIGQYDIVLNTLIKVYPSIVAASKATGICYNTICNPLRGKTASGKEKTAGGYFWRFVDPDNLPTPEI